MTPTTQPSTRGATILLVVIAAVLGLFGFMLQSQATSGTVMVGLAVLFGVFARINQAAHQHREQWQWLQTPTEGRSILTMDPGERSQ